MFFLYFSKGVAGIYALFLYPIKNNVMDVNNFDDNLTAEPSGYYCILPYVVLQDQSLSDFSKLLYALLMGLKNQKGYCWASNAYLGNALGKDKLTVSRTLSILESKGYISMYYNPQTSVRHIFCEADRVAKRIVLKEFRNTSFPIDKNVKGVDENIKGGLTKMSRGVDENVNHNNIIEIDNYNTVDLKVDGAGKESKSTIAKTQKEVEATPAIAKTTKEKTDAAPAIIALLNEITGRAFRASDSSLRPIRARLREGFTMDDFSAVIRLKNSQWANRADMRQYLRPETLFGNKFDGYVQEAKALASTKIPVVEGETDDYRKYLRWCETYYPNLGANFALDERTNHDLTKGKAYDNHRTLLPKSALLAHYKEAHRLCNEQVGRTGVCKGVKATYIELINQAIK